MKNVHRAHGSTAEGTKPTGQGQRLGQGEGGLNLRISGFCSSLFVSPACSPGS